MKVSEEDEDNELMYGAGIGDHDELGPDLDDESEDSLSLDITESDDDSDGNVQDQGVSLWA